MQAQIIQLLIKYRMNNVPSGKDHCNYLTVFSCCPETGCSAGDFTLFVCNKSSLNLMNCH